MHLSVQANTVNWAAVKFWQEQGIERFILSRELGIEEMEEDEHGSYILNSRDLRAVEYVEQLTRMGVHSLKIEGRTKSPYYVARTAQVYRRAIDDAVADKAFDPNLLFELEGLANRGYTAGLLDRHARPETLQNLERAHHNGAQQWVAEPKARLGDWYEVEAKNGFSVGERLYLLTPEGNQPFELTALQDKSGTPIARAPGSGHRVRLQLQVDCDPDTALLVKQL